MAQAQAQREEKARERTYAYQVTTGSGALQRTFIVELTRPLERNPNRPQESMLEQLRDAIRRTGSTGEERTVASVKEVNPLTGNPERISLQRFREQLHEDVIIAPIVRAR